MDSLRDLPRDFNHLGSNFVLIPSSFQVPKWLLVPWWHLPIAPPETGGLKKDHSGEGSNVHVGGSINEPRKEKKTILLLSMKYTGSFIRDPYNGLLLQSPHIWVVCHHHVYTKQPRFFHCSNAPRNTNMTKLNHGIFAIQFMKKDAIHQYQGIKSSKKMLVSNIQESSIFLKFPSLKNESIWKTHHLDKS